MIEKDNTSGWGIHGATILVRMKGKEETTEGGIILPDDTTRRSALGQDTGVVVAMGDNAYADQTHPWCKIGDTIRFARHSGEILSAEATEDGKEYRVVPDLCVVLVKKDLK